MAEKPVILKFLHNFDLDLVTDLNFDRNFDRSASRRCKFGLKTRTPNPRARDICRGGRSSGPGRARVNMHYVIYHLKASNLPNLIHYK